MWKWGYTATAVHVESTLLRDRVPQKKRMKFSKATRRLKHSPSFTHRESRGGACSRFVFAAPFLAAYSGDIRDMTPRRVRAPVGAACSLCHRVFPL